MYFRIMGFRDKEFLAEHGAERYAKTAEDVLRFVKKCRGLADCAVTR